MATLRLGEMLLARGLITRQQLDAALAAQLQFGGRLGTNLVELGIIDDGRLAASLSEQLGVPYVKPQALAAVPRDVIALMPANMAKKYRAVPLRAQGSELAVCVADPHNFENLDELAFALSRKLKPYVVTEVTLNYALERYYNIPREPRLGGSMTGGVTGWREVGGGPTHDAGAVPRSFGSLLAAPTTERRAPEPTVVDQMAAVMNEDDVTTALFRYFCELFEEVVLMASVGGRPTPVMAGSRAQRRPCPSTAQGLGDGPALRALLEKPQVLHHPRLADPALGALAASFGLPVVNVTLLSIFNGHHPAYAVLGHGLDEPRLKASFDGLRAMIVKANQAMRIVALRNDIRG